MKNNKIRTIDFSIEIKNSQKNILALIAKNRGFMKDYAGFMFKNKFNLNPNLPTINGFIRISGEAIQVNNNLCIVKGKIYFVIVKFFILSFYFIPIIIVLGVIMLFYFFHIAIFLFFYSFLGLIFHFSNDLDSELLKFENKIEN